MVRTDTLVERSALAQRAIQLRAEGREWAVIAAELGVPRQKLDRAVRKECAVRPTADLGVWRETETAHLLSVRREALAALAAASAEQDWRSVAALVRSLSAVSTSLQRLLGLEAAPPVPGSGGPVVNVINVPADRVPPATWVPGVNWHPPGARELGIVPDAGTFEGAP